MNEEKMTECSSCGGRIAKDASRCPKCGHNISEPNVAGIIIGLVLLVGGIFVFMGGI